MLLARARNQGPNASTMHRTAPQSHLALHAGEYSVAHMATDNIKGPFGPGSSLF